MNMKVWTLLGVVLSVYVPVNADRRPVIGVLTQNYDGKKSQQVIATSMVDFLTEHGAIVVPIMAYDSQSKQLAEFKKYNGFVLPGSNGPGEGYKRTYKRLMKWAINSSKRPEEGAAMMGAGFCWGMQRMANYVAKRTVSGGSYWAQNVNLPVEYTSANSTKQDFRITRGLSTYLDSKLTSRNLTYNNHIHGVSPETMKNNRYLKAFYNVVYTSDSPRDGKRFVALMEAKDMPLYGFQFHPEGWASSSTQRKANSYFANFLVTEAKKSIRRYPDSEDPVQLSVQKVGKRVGGIYKLGNW